jgi:hypothetical protein
MSLSALSKFVIPPVMASAVVFAAMTIPLVKIGDNQVNIKIQEEPFFSGKVRDIATPYVVLATVLSLGAGVSATAACGWQLSSRKSTELEQEISILQKNLQEKEELLKEFKLSESRLQISGLNTFLDHNEESVEPPLSGKTIKTTATHSRVALTQEQASLTPVSSVRHQAAQQKTNETAALVSATSTFASAQRFLGYGQKNTNTTDSHTVIQEVNQTTITPSDVEELQRQLREMMLQMQVMQNSLQLMPQGTNHELETQDRFKIYYNSPNTEEVRV